AQRMGIGLARRAGLRGGRDVRIELGHVLISWIVADNASDRWTGTPGAVAPGRFWGVSGRRGGRAGRRLCSGDACAAVRAHPPVDDVGDLDVEAVVVMRDQAGRLADGAGHVLQAPALAAHQVVVVVVTVHLVAHAAAAD